MRLYRLRKAQPPNPVDPGSLHIAGSIAAGELSISQSVSQVKPCRRRRRRACVFLGEDPRRDSRAAPWVILTISSPSCTGGPCHTRPDARAGAFPFCAGQCKQIDPRLSDSLALDQPLRSNPSVAHHHQRSIVSSPFLFLPGIQSTRTHAPVPALCLIVVCPAA